MTYLDELAIKEAVRNQDGKLLASTVHDMPFPSFDEIKATVLETPGGSQLVAGNRIELGRVWILNHFNAPLVYHR